jgi:hypothetical protein
VKSAPERLDPSALCDFCGRIDDCYVSEPREGSGPFAERTARICGGCIVKAATLFAQQAAGHVGAQAKKRLGEAGVTTLAEVLQLFRGRK